MKCGISKEYLKSQIFFTTLQRFNFLYYSVSIDDNFTITSNVRILHSTRKCYKQEQVENLP